MKENKDKEVMDEVVDLGDLPSRRGREKKHRSSKSQNVQSIPLVPDQKPPVQILDSEPKDSSFKKISSTVHAPTSSQPSKETLQHLLGNEDLA